MTRPLRIEYEDACYHAMNRGRGRQWVFPDKKNIRSIYKMPKRGVQTVWH